MQKTVKMHNKEKINSNLISEEIKEDLVDLILFEEFNDIDVDISKVMTENGDIKIVCEIKRNRDGRKVKFDLISISN